jgi:hypothetical protein
VKGRRPRPVSVSPVGALYPPTSISAAGYAMMRGWPEPEYFIDRGVSGSVWFADRPEGKRWRVSLSARPRSYVYRRPLIDLSIYFEPDIPSVT